MVLTFGQWQRQRRKARGWSQEELAQQVGCSAVLIRKIESNERRPSREVAALIIQHLTNEDDDREALLQLARVPLLSVVGSASEPRSLSTADPIVGTQSFSRFTEREREIWDLIGADLPDAVIAERLALKLSTVRWYVKQIYSKLGAHSREEAIARAQALNLLDLGPTGEDAAQTSAAKETLRPAPRIISRTADRNRYQMLRNVRSFWIDGLLEHSLHGAVLIDLGLKQRPDSTGHPWDSLLRIPELPDERLPIGTRLLSVFDRLNGKLLILGEPGSGKTTTMLDLARDLLNRAEANAECSMPVIFNLSSWTEQQKSLADWLVDELGGKYQVPKKVAQNWVDHDELLLLLDGFDEVARERREACATAINDFRRVHGFVDIVVCSRTADYEPLLTRLNLNGAVALEPLTEAQVNTYLSSLGAEMAGVQAALIEDEALRELSRSPLMLSILALAYRGAAAEDLPRQGTPEMRRRHLFDVYVQRMFERRSGDQPYSRQQTTHYLSWLARKMAEHSQSVLHIEKLQPAWLTQERRPKYYRAFSLAYSLPASLLFAGLPLFLTASYMGIPASLGLAMGLAYLSFGWVFTSNWWKAPLGHTFYSLVFGLIAGGNMWMGRGPLAGLIIGIFTAAFFLMIGLPGNRLLRQRGSDRDHIAVVERLYFSSSHLRPWLAVLAFLVGCGLVFALRAIISSRDVSAVALILSLIGSGTVMASFVLTASSLTSGEVEQRARPNQGIYSSLDNANRAALLFGSLLFLFCILGFGSTVSATYGVGAGLAIAPIITQAYWLFYGGYSVLQHLALRHILYRDGLIPRNYAHFLDYATRLILLRKVGGGYVFVHRYLLEYFTSLDR